MDAQLPGVPEGLDHLGFLGQVGVVAVLHVALADEGLEVAAVLDAVGRVDVDHLHPAGQALLVQQAVHHQQAVAGHQPVGPAALVAVEVDGVAQRQVLEGGVEEAGLDGFRRALGFTLTLHRLAHRRQDAGRVDALVHVQADGVDLEAGALGLAGPGEVGGLQAPELFEGFAHALDLARGQGVVDQLLDGGALGVELQGGVEVGVVGPAGLAGLGVGGRGDHAHLGVVLALVGVAVGDDLRRFAGSGAGLGFDGAGGGRPLARGRLGRGRLGARLHLQRKAVGRVGEVGGSLDRRLRHGADRRPPHRAAAALPLHQHALGDQGGVGLPVVVVAERQPLGLQQALDGAAQRGVADRRAVGGNAGQHRAPDALMQAGHGIHSLIFLLWMAGGRRGLIIASGPCICHGGWARPGRRRA